MNRESLLSFSPFKIFGNMEKTKKNKVTTSCSIVSINDTAANRPDNKAKTIKMPKSPVLYFFNIG